MRLAGKYSHLETILDPEWERMFVEGGVTPVFASGYACFTRRKRGQGSYYKKEFIHQIVTNHRSSKTVVVDHRNGNRLDNREANLKVTRQSENCKNREFVGCNSNNKLRAVGVFQRRDTGKFVVHLKLNYKIVYRQEFDNFEDARAVAEFNNKIRNK